MRILLCLAGEGREEGGESERVESMRKETGQSKRVSICLGRLPVMEYRKISVIVNIVKVRTIQEAKHVFLCIAAGSSLVSKYLLDQTFLIDLAVVRVDEHRGSAYILLPIAFLGNSSTAFSSCGIL